MRRDVVIILALLIFIGGVSILIAHSITKQSISYGDKVAIIPIYGEITMGDGTLSSKGVTPTKLRKYFEQACEDSSIKAVVLEINSPGGSVVASEEIAELVKKCKKEKPVVAWLGDIATSGAYYVASSSSYIVADKASITGSIGVISIFPEYSGLLKKIGINVTIIKAGEYKDFASGFRPMREEEKEMMQSVIMEIYEEFIREVAENRNLSEEYIKKLAEGKIYSGKQAKEFGLVDEVGSKEKAIKKACELAGIEGEPEVITYYKRSFFEELLGNSFERIGYGIAKGLIEYKGEIKIS
ncbi:MAG: signal peptide peptidase SppA [Candidatus Hydrothermarchaeota archaeon]|nr:MAG: signal peptide peptidase SppA [Candidatus Hydrothermarchaeota archaeon]